MSAYGASTQLGPKVGIFWQLADERSSELVVDTTLMTEAERYGDHLTHPRGHYEVWENWRRIGLVERNKRGLPHIILWHEYEDFPRGRVVFDTVRRRYTIYADRRLHDPEIVLRIAEAFSLSEEEYTVQHDSHYQ